MDSVATPTRGMGSVSAGLTQLGHTSNQLATALTTAETSPVLAGFASIMPLNVQLDTFEGPLSLLLYLIKKDELDIYDIPVHTITKQYLEYIQIMKELNLEVAGEFVAMAATLIYIKSRMLVPSYGENGEEIAVDPRKELVQKLLEYQKYQEAGRQLYKRPLLGRDIWLRGSRENIVASGDDEIIVDDKGLFGLISAFRQLQKEVVATVHTVNNKGLSIAARLLEIKDRLVVGQRIEFRDLLNAEFTRTELMITFLSLLELSRLGYTRIFQTEPLAPIYIDTVKLVSTDDIVRRVQEFDNLDAEITANKIMVEAKADLETESIQESVESQLDLASLENDAEVLAVESGEIE